MEEAKQLFEYYGVNNKCVGLFGSWAVNADQRATLFDALDFIHRD